MSDTPTEGQLIEALRYPTKIIGQEIDMSACKQAGSFNREDAECITCYQTPECEWLLRHGRNSNYEPLNYPQLVAALQFACDYMHARLSIKRHTPEECPCEGCNWWRNASALLNQSESEPA